MVVANAVPYGDVLFVVGIHPAPRSWMMWNFEALEPDEVKSQKKLLAKSVDHKTKRKIF